MTTDNKESKQLSLDEKLNKLIERIEEHGKNIEELLEYHISTKQILTKFDIIKAFGIKITTYNELELALKTTNTTKDQVEKIKYILQKISGYDKTLHIINDKSIKSGARVGKWAMTYMMKEEQVENDLVIINVSVDPEHDPITIKKLKKEI